LTGPSGGTVLILDTPRIFHLKLWTPPTLGVQARYALRRKRNKIGKTANRHKGGRSRPAGGLGRTPLIDARAPPGKDNRA
jgi:hypothetical protein